NQDEEQRGNSLLFGMPAAARKMRRKHPDEDGDRKDADHRDGVGQIHEFWLGGVDGLQKRCGRTPLPYGHYAPAGDNVGARDIASSKEYAESRRKKGDGTEPSPFCLISVKFQA